MSERAPKHDRHRVIRELIAAETIGSQYELAARLADAGYPVTQATVSRDIAELGLVKAPHHEGHAYVSPADLAGRGDPGHDGGPRAPDAPERDDRLRRLLGDLPVSVGRSGLILVLRSAPGMANAIGQAIDESSLQEQEGTLAGDDTLLVLFADESRLDRWLGRFRRLQAAAGVPVAAAPGRPGRAADPRPARPRPRQPAGTTTPPRPRPPLTEVLR